MIRTEEVSAPAPTPATAATAERGRLRLRGLGWLMWRQLRLPVWGWLALVAVAAVAAVVFHAREVSYFSSHQIAGCAEISLDPACQQPGIQQSVMEFRTTYGEPLKLAGLALLLLPVGLGAALGAPLLAQELERGTWKVVLTQPVSRTRWVLAKLAAVALSAGLGSVALMLIYRWVWQPGANDVSGIAWYSTVFFASGGPVLVSTVLLALAVGALAGAVLRRTQPAMAATVVLVGLLQYGLDTLRPYLWGWQTELVSRSELPNNTWGFAQGFMTPSGTRLPYDICGRQLDYLSCTKRYADAREYTDLHHVADYWPLQLVESGIGLALALALVVGTLYWVRRRLG
ncbi:ABC transporter permease subunit [Kitasatospora azatica]|uniref:ABC transporter permease subunit n=1 Tax=Kitasatospora azatica TaxID=58347 RepID=UPI00068A2C08|nr:ABC transporter permease subunit [Kitasatospora azatica]